MLELLTDPQAWISLATLSVLEIVLGIDNIIFLSIVSARLPVQQQATRAADRPRARAAHPRPAAVQPDLADRADPADLRARGFAVSWRDIVLAGGGLFLIVKGTIEIHHMLEGHGGESVAGSASFAAVIAQIVLLDLVFSLDSVITAIGIAEHIPVMMAAIVIAMTVMLLAAEPTARFVNAHPTVKMLALSFLLLVGVALVADGAALPHPARLPLLRDRVLDRRRVAQSAGRARTPRAPKKPASDAGS